MRSQNGCVQKDKTESTDQNDQMTGPVLRARNRFVNLAKQSPGRQVKQEQVVE